MPSTVPDPEETCVLRALPGDDVRRILWRFADRPDLQKVALSARRVARGPVARLVADGALHTNEWTEAKSRLLPAFDDAGITTLSLEPEYGGYLRGPKNLAMALAAFEMAWVDGGAATCGMAGHLALAPIHERGTPEQKQAYMGRVAPPKPGETRRQLRGAFALTEPLPYVGVNTRTMSGRVRVAEWIDGREPILQVDKQGRFITNMGFANFVTAAVESADPRIKGSCMVILEETDPGTFDRGTPARKLVHQLSSTTDPVLSLRVPASRIIGGYDVVDGVIVPRYEHGEIIAAVFRRTRVTVGLMTAGKLLSAIEPVIRYQRGRYRGNETLAAGSPMYDLGLQQKEDSLHRLVDVWATGEASASMGFAAARFFDEFDPLERTSADLFAAQGLGSARARMRALKEKEPAAIRFVEMSAQPPEKRDADLFARLESDPLVQFVVKDALANVLCPATKLWNTGHGVNMMREAVSLMGGSGITEDCPGFLGQKWMDAQLEATYEGPEAVQRRQLAITMTSDVFLAHFRAWITEMRGVAAARPGTGACTVASAMELWLWTLRHLLEAEDALGHDLFHDKRQGVTFPMADALCWLVASRYQILDLLALEKDGARVASIARDLPGCVSVLSDLCHVQAARGAGEVARICSELVFGYRRHPSWEIEGRSCFPTERLDALEGLIPGIGASAHGITDVLEEDGSHAAKAGPCVSFRGMEPYARLRAKLDGCLTGSRLAKDRAAHALTQVSIPEVPDYPS